MVDKFNPEYYKKGGIEVTDFIIEKDLDFLEGNIIKYVCRYKYKGGLDDLKKAKWYLDKLILKRKNEQKSSDL